MRYEPKKLTLKNGSPALLRSPMVNDAAAMLRYLKQSAEETDYLLRYPEECNDTLEQEKAFLLNMNRSGLNMMIVCDIGGQVVGCCQLALNQRMKVQHRASVSIALLKEYWGLGIGTAMMREMIAAAYQHNVAQLELEVIEGNERAMNLYRRMGFQVYGERPDAIRLKNGVRLKEYLMLRRL